MTLPQKCQILDHHSSYVTVSNFLHYTPSPVSPGKYWQTFSLIKYHLLILYNWYVTGTN